MKEKNTVIEPEVMEVIPASTAIQAVSRAEMDVQIATAKAYPRKIDECLNDVRALACQDQETAEGMYYTLERTNQDGEKVPIVGPSIRFAEIVGYGWKNLRYGFDIVSIDETHVTACGFCFDLERNTGAKVNVKRRITNRKGKRFSEDMIVTTANAAGAIAVRNAMFKVIPFALVRPIWERAKEVAVGPQGELERNRVKEFKRWETRGITAQQLLKLLKRQSAEEVTVDDLVTLSGYRTAIKEETTTLERLFAEKGEEAAETADLNAKIKAAQEAKLRAAQKRKQPEDPESVAEATTEEKPAETAKKPQKTATTPGPGEHVIQGEKSPWCGQRVDTETRERWIEIMTSRDGQIGLTEADIVVINAYVQSEN